MSNALPIILLGLAAVVSFLVGKTTGSTPTAGGDNAPTAPLSAIPKSRVPHVRDLIASPRTIGYTLYC